MPYNPSGIFTLPNGTLAEAGTTIRVAQHNPAMQDIAQGLSQVLLRNGAAPMTGPLAMGGNRITGMANGTAPTDAATVGQVTPYSGFLASVSALAITSDDMVYATGPTAAAKTKVTAFARTLLDDASAAAMRTTLVLGAVATDNVVPVARGGTGGTTQAAARTGLGLGASATLPLATQAEAQAGTDNSSVMTPLRTDQHTVATAVGWGQSWQGVTGSRNPNTSYTNNTGRPIVVQIFGRGDGGRNLQVSTNGTSWVTVARLPLWNEPQGMADAIVPSGHRYRLEGSDISIGIWAELR